MSFRTVGSVVLIVAVASLMSGYVLYNRATSALPVGVVVEPAELAGNVRLFGLLANGWENQWDGWTSTGSWRVKKKWLAGLRLALPRADLAKLTELRATVGGKQFRYTAADLERMISPDSEAWAAGEAGGGIKADTVVLELPDEIRGEGTSIPRFAGLRNWPGDGAFIAALLSFLGLRLGVVAAVVALAWVARRVGPVRRAADRFLAEPPAAPVPWGRWWDAAGVAFLAASLTFLEVRTPFYFTQDDALVSELPAQLVGLRAAWAGEFPDYNPHFFLGGPLASIGFCQLTYPPLYLGYAIARHVFGNEYLLVDVNAVVNLLIGYGLTRLLAGRLGIGRPAAVLVALTFVLSGPVLMMGRCWSLFLPNVVWIPAVMLGVQRLAAGPVGVKWVLAVGVSVGLFFHTGFTQNAAFACGFAVAAVGYLSAVGAVPGRRAVMLVPALLVGAGVAVPLMYQQYRLMKLVDRGYEAGGPTVQLVPAMVLPYPLVEASHPEGWGNVDLERIGHLAFLGGLFPVLVVVEIAALLVARPRGPAWGRRVWLVLAGLAFWLVLGEDGLIWVAGSKLPVVGSLFRYSFRMLPLLAFFAALAGGLVLDRLLRKSAAPGKWASAVAAVAGALLGWHLWNMTPAFYVYGFTPYPPLLPVLEAAAAEMAAGRGRFLAKYADRSTDPEFVDGLPQNIAMVHGIPSLEGYSPINENKVYQRARAALDRTPIETARAYGVRYVIVLADSTKTQSMRSLGYEWAIRNEVAVDALRPVLVPRVSGGRVTLFELPGADPMAFATPGVPLPVRYGGAGVRVDTAGVAAGQTVTANFLWYPEIHAYLDGRPLPTGPDQWNRITVTLPEAGRELAIRYEPPWATGLALGAAFAAAGLLAAWVIGQGGPRADGLPGTVGGIPAPEAVPARG